jgi:hypothetical protein
MTGRGTHAPARTGRCRSTDTSPGLPPLAADLFGPPANDSRARLAVRGGVNVELLRSRSPRSPA